MPSTCPHRSLQLTEHRLRTEKRSSTFEQGRLTEQTNGCAADVTVFQVHCFDCREDFVFSAQNIPGWIQVLMPQLRGGHGHTDQAADATQTIIAEECHEYPYDRNH